MRPEQLSIQARFERQIRALVVLSRRWPTYEADREQSTRAIIQAAAVAVGVERASIWSLSADGDALVCQDLYEATPHRHSRGYKLAEDDCPAYFAALQTEAWIVASDAHQDPRTACFSGAYLTPHGIGAILDIPLRVAGKVCGVLRLEHVGGARAYQTDEQITASYLASLASLAAEVQRGAELAAANAAASSLLDASLEAAGVAILVLDQRGAVLYHNQRLLELWRMGPELMGADGDGGRRIEHIAALTQDPARFIARYRRISSDLTDSSSDLIELKDGRTVERSSAPQWRDGEAVGRAWCFREVDDA